MITLNYSFIHSILRGIVSRIYLYLLQLLFLFWDILAFEGDSLKLISNQSYTRLLRIFGLLFFGFFLYYCYKNLKISENLEKLISKQTQCCHQGAELQPPPVIVDREIF